MQKYVAHLVEARAARFAPDRVAARAVALVGMKGEAATLTAEAMVRNVTIQEVDQGRAAERCRAKSSGGRRRSEFFNHGHERAGWEVGGPRAGDGFPSESGKRESGKLVHPQRTR